jgi:dimethylaniline monooxygenase (N-oxide forming)
LHCNKFTDVNDALPSLLPLFFRWPQTIDEMLEDMGLQTYRSGGNWLTWPFKVIELKEIEHLKEERDALRAQGK